MLTGNAFIWTHINPALGLKSLPIYISYMKDLHKTLAVFCTFWLKKLLQNGGAAIN